MKNNHLKIKEKLSIMYPDARCELNYFDDFSLLVSIVLSAQSTDKMVNEVTKDLF